MNGAVVESVYTADSKSAASRACGFESRPRYQYDSKGVPLRRSVYDMGMIIDDELIVLDGNEDNPMEELKDYTKRKRRSNKSKAKNSKSIFKLPSFLKK